MQRIDLPDIDAVSLRASIDHGSYLRGVRYAREGAVAQLRWEPARSALQGLVRGSTGGFYTTIAYFSPAAGDVLAFSGGVCSCPVAADCKHVVALVVTAVGLGAVPKQPPPAPGWQARIDSLLASTPATGPGAVPLAIELTLVPGPPLKLTARLVQPRGNGWVGGSLSWSKLDTLRYYGSYSAEQVRVLQEIYALYRYGSGRLGQYGYGDEKYIDISAFESSQLWPLLDEANDAGLRLLQRGRVGDVPKYQQAQVCLDVSDRPEGSLVISAYVAGLPAGAVPVRFIGSDGHGLVYSEASSVLVGLARLATAVPQPLQQMVLAGEHLEVPATARSAFSEGYYHRLRQAAPIVSLDGSFTPPVTLGPTLVLQAAYLGGHGVDVGWKWAYEVGVSRLRFDPAEAGQIDPCQHGCRDLAAEQAIVAGLDGPVADLGLVSGGPSAPALTSRVRLGGIDTIRFSTEVLPLLSGQPGVVAEVTGEPADYREVGDSLRIGVSAGAIPGDADWFDLGITITVDGRTVPFADVFVALSQGDSHLLLSDGAYFALDKPELVALGRLIDEARALQDVPGNGLRISRFQAGLWRELTELGAVRHQAAAWRAQVAGLMAASALERRQPPAGLHARLRPYQLEGFQWLAFLWENKLGGILADDMGLGKTVQSLALISHARQAEPSGAPFLVVAPTSVVTNWAAEAARFAPGIRVVTVRETEARRGQPLSDLIAGADAVVTSYALFRIDIGAYAAAEWGGLILDEAQFAKNYHSKIYHCARRLRAGCKLAITGTPMENNLMELWALLSITAPGLFPNPDRFKEYYARPIERSGDADLLAQLRRRIRPLVMRRTKEQVADDLPAKQEQVLEVELHPRHRKLYELQLQRERQKVLGLLDDLNANRFTILRSLTLLRQLSLHAGLIDEANANVPSSKIDLLIDQLDDVIGGGHRALVFSQFTRFLAIVRQELDARGIGYCYLDGKTRDRADVLERFASGAVPVFVISLKAGGFGLNLTAADYCFLLDPWWNPATEAQAVDRAHRIGQTRNVMVYRLIAADTIEQKVMALKARKAALFGSVLDQGNVFGAELQADDLRELLG
jgi:superfamily II DNA or RNA helicase